MSKKVLHFFAALSPQSSLILYLNSNIWHKQVPYGQKGVDGRSHWRTDAMATEVRLDGWCEGDLRQQRNDCGGCATMRERSERMASSGTYVTE